MCKRLLYLTLSLICLNHPASAQKLVLSPELQRNTEMHVKGRQGWQFNQVIRFGNFSTSKVKRGWTTSYDVGFTLRFQKAQEKLSFTQLTPEGRQAEVLVVSRFQNTEYELLRGFLAYSLRYENTCAGSIIPSGNRDSTWDFVVYNPEGNIEADPDCGVASDNWGNKIHIRGIQQREGQPRWTMGANYGFEFVRDGHTVAAVSTINNGNVWMNDGLDANTRLVVAALSSALLVRHNVTETVGR